MTKLTILPDPQIFNTFRHMNYSLGDAFAEFIDNAIQSARDHELKEVNVSIDISSVSIRIRDDAGGIAAHNWQRALTPASRPPATKGSLCEFGMGMKTAAIWLASKWTVESRDRNELPPMKRTVPFSLRAMDTETTSGAVTLKVEDHALANDEDFLPGTQIILTDLARKINSHDVKAMKESLREIYPLFLNGEEAEKHNFPKLILTVDGELLNPEDLGVLEKPVVGSDDLTPVKWDRTNTRTVTLGEKDMTVTIRTWVRETGSSKTGRGFTLFRRGRRVHRFIPDIRGVLSLASPTNLLSQRLAGYIILPDDVEVSHLKDHVVLNEDDQRALAEMLRDFMRGDVHASDVSLRHDMVRQARDSRVRQSAAQVSAEAAAEMAKVAAVMTSATNAMSVEFNTEIALNQGVDGDDLRDRLPGSTLFAGVKVSHEERPGGKFFIIKTEKESPVDSQSAETIHVTVNSDTDAYPHFLSDTSPSVREGFDTFVAAAAIFLKVCVDRYDMNVAPHVALEAMGDVMADLVHTARKAANHQDGSAGAVH